MPKLALYTESDRERPLAAVDKGYEPEPYRSEWRKDYGRVIHSTSFRRLQGKTQLFYGEGAVFRNRLTHSLEVAQIAKSLAIKIAYETDLPVNPDICEVAGLLHDLGHPPFGHNGEKALDDKMKGSGGFEGNAQTLRIVSRLDKRRKNTDAPHGISEDGEDYRFGMNLTYRVLAAVLKYDDQIPFSRSPDAPVAKGYYEHEKELVKEIKQKVLGEDWQDFSGQFKTIECAIMDVADDIAYSTYDLEDAWKSQFLNPLELLGVSGEKLTRITEKVQRDPQLRDSTEGKVADALYSIVVGEFSSVAEEARENFEGEGGQAELALAATLDRFADELAGNGFARTAFTSSLVERFIQGVEVDVDEEYPAMSKVRLDRDTSLLVAALKHYTYVSVIESPRLRIPEFRGYEIVAKLFESISKSAGEGVSLLPEDFREAYYSIPESEVVRRKRLISDFIAGMTDNYAASFYNRLVSDYPETVFGPDL